MLPYRRVFLVFSLYSHSAMSPSRFFAGGSERSGQQIVGPPKKKSSNEVVEDLFKGAREHGAVPLERSGRGPGEPSRARVKQSTQEPHPCPFPSAVGLLLLTSYQTFFLFVIKIDLPLGNHLGLCWWRIQARSSS